MNPILCQLCRRQAEANSVGTYFSENKTFGVAFPHTDVCQECATLFIELFEEIVLQNSASNEMSQEEKIERLVYRLTHSGAAPVIPTATDSVDQLLKGMGFDFT